MNWKTLFDDNRSVWTSDNEPYVDAPPLSGDLDVDVAIVGAGFTGLSTAYHLSERFPEKRIAIVEARRVANGASGRNGGQMLNWVHGFETDDPQLAARIYEATREGIDSVVSVIERHKLDVPHRRNGHLDVFVRPEDAERAAAEAERFQTSNVPIRFLARDELTDHIGLEGVSGALFDPEAGVLDGVAYLRALRPVLEGRGVSIYEHTPVVRVTEGRRVSLVTPDAEIRADAIVLATNAYTPHLGYFKMGLVPVHSHVVGTEALSPSAWAERGWATNSKLHR